MLQGIEEKITYIFSISRKCKKKYTTFYDEYIELNLKKSIESTVTAIHSEISCV